MSDVVAAMHECGSLKTLLEQEFRRALSQLVYPHKRSYSDVCDHITTVVKFLSEDPDFLNSICLEILGLVREHADKTDMVLAARQGNQLNVCGTFQAAIHAQIINTVSQMFAFVLEHMDRDYGLALFGDANLKKLWYYSGGYLKSTSCIATVWCKFMSYIVQLAVYHPSRSLRLFLFHKSFAQSKLKFQAAKMAEQRKIACDVAGLAKSKQEKLKISKLQP